MNRVRLWLSAVGAVVYRDTAIFISYRTQAFSRAFGAIVSVAMFYYVSQLVSTKAFATPADYFAFVVVGIVIAQLVNATLSALPGAVQGALMQGTLERFLVSEFGVVNGVIAMLVFPTIVALLTGVVTIATGAILFGMPLAWSTIALAIPASILGSVAFVPFTLLFASVVLAFKQLPPGSSFLVAGLTLVSGLYFPIELLPSWVRWLQHVQPYSPTVELLRHLISGSPTSESPWILVARIVGFVVVLMPIGLWAISRAVVFGRERGSLIEY